jgi:hypothetical protein
MELIFGNSTNSYWSIQSVEQGVANRNLAINPSGGNVGIGTTSPGTLLDTRGFASYRGNAYAIASFCGNNTLAPLNIVQSTNGTAPGISAGQNSSAAFQPLVLLTSEVVRQTISATGTTTLNCDTATSPLQIQINSSEVARIDSSGRLLVGTSTAPTVQGLQSKFNVTVGDEAAALIGRWSANEFGPTLILAKSRGASPGTSTILSSGDQVGVISFAGADGNDVDSVAAQIICSLDNTPGANDMPGRLVFSTTADGAASPTERLRITSAGVLQVADAGNITVGTTTGTKIGTGTTQKLGFYNATPVVQPTAVADATDAATVITQLNALLTRMRNLGLIAT